ncbi:unnamed protein product, partial [Effrenium voratum]
PAHSLRSGHPLIVSLSLVVALLTLASRTAFVAPSVQPVSHQVSVAAVQAPQVRSAAPAWPACLLATAALGCAALRSRSPKATPKAKVVATRSLPVSVPCVPVPVSATVFDVAPTTCDLISLDTAPVVHSMAQDTIPAADAAPAAAINLGPKQPAFGRSRPRGEGARARHARQRVGAKLTARAVAQPAVVSFEPSKVRRALQQAIMVGSQHTNSRETQVLMEAPGLSASQDIGLKSSDKKRKNDVLHLPDMF